MDSSEPSAPYHAVLALSKALEDGLHALECMVEAQEASVEIQKTILEAEVGLLRRLKELCYLYSHLQHLQQITLLVLGLQMLGILGYLLWKPLTRMWAS